MQDDDAVDVVSFEQSLSVEGQCAVAMAAVPLILHQLRDRVANRRPSVRTKATMTWRKSDVHVLSESRYAT